MGANYTLLHGFDEVPMGANYTLLYGFHEVPYHLTHIVLHSFNVLVVALPLILPGEDGTTSKYTTLDGGSINLKVMASSIVSKST